MSSGLSKNKLIEFLYLLMRDAAPTGEIVRIVRMMKTEQRLSEATELSTFSSPELHSYAVRLAEELL